MIIGQERKKMVEEDLFYLKKKDYNGGDGDEKNYQRNLVQ
jgi:hypothetical protein